MISNFRIIPNYTMPENDDLPNVISGNSMVSHFHRTLADTMTTAQIKQEFIHFLRIKLLLRRYKKTCGRVRRNFREKGILEYRNIYIYYMKRTKKNCRQKNIKKYAKKTSRNTPKKTHRKKRNFNNPTTKIKRGGEPDVIIQDCKIVLNNMGENTNFRDTHEYKGRTMTPHFYPNTGDGDPFLQDIADQTCKYETVEQKNTETSNYVFQAIKKDNNGDIFKDDDNIIYVDINFGAHPGEGVDYKPDYKLIARDDAYYDANQNRHLSGITYLQKGLFPQDLNFILRSSKRKSYYEGKLFRDFILGDIMFAEYNSPVNSHIPMYSLRQKEPSTGVDNSVVILKYDKMSSGGQKVYKDFLEKLYEDEKGLVYWDVKYKPLKYVKLKNSFKENVYFEDLIVAENKTNIEFKLKPHTNLAGKTSKQIENLQLPLTGQIRAYIA
jgi:hypothetical protein